MSKKKEIAMKVNLTPEEEEAYETISSVTPWATRHARLRAALRLGLALAKEEPEKMFIQSKEVV